METILCWAMPIYIVGVIYTMLKLVDIDPETPVEKLKFHSPFLVFLSWFGALFLLVLDIINYYKDR